MKSITSTVLAFLGGLTMVVGGFLAYNAQTPGANLGASNDIPTVVALFESSLASSITADATSFTLTGATDKDGNVLASSTYAFIIDEGTASEEFVIADCTGTACTNAERGISVLTGTSSVEALKKSHRRGASVKITNGPQLILLSNLANGIQGYPNPLKYDGISTTTLSLNQDNIASIEYVNDVAFTTGGIVAASEAASGYVELATQSEMAAGTQTGGSGEELVVQSRYSSSTSPGAGFWNVVTLATGFISETFFPSTFDNDYTFNGNNTFTATTSFTGPVTFASTTSVIVFESSGTYTKPDNLAYIEVQGVGAGGGADSDDQGAGGGGGYFWKLIPASDLSATTSVTIGTRGSRATNGGTAGGATSFGSFATANGGGASGGAGGTATGGDINLQGQNGREGSTGTGGNYSSSGGSVLGLGANGNTTVPAGYGSGAAEDHDGKNGVIIIKQFFR